MSISVHIIKFFMRTIYIPLSFMLLTFSALAFLSPRIPPFVGYFLCRSCLDWWSGGDICGLNDDGFFNIISWNVLFNIFCIVGGCASVVVFATSAYNVVLMGFYEVFPTILFQNDRLSQLRREVKNCTFSKHTSLSLTYRHIQVLNIMFNRIYERNFFAFGMSTIVVLLISNGNFVIKMPQVHPIYFILGFYTILMEYACICYCSAWHLRCRAIRMNLYAVGGEMIAFHRRQLQEDMENLCKF
jgi:hypothetical protein